MAEGAGAAGLAAIFAEPERFKGKRIGLVLCGGNIDPRVAASIMVRELERDDRIVSYRISGTLRDPSSACRSVMSPRNSRS
jgi:threonine dehydratase